MGLALSLCLGQVSTYVSAAHDTTEPYNVMEGAEAAARALSTVMHDQTVVVLNPRLVALRNMDYIKIGVAIGNEMRSALGRDSGVRLLARNQLKAALEEMGVNHKDYLGPEYFGRLSRLTGAQIIVVSDLVNGPNAFELTAQAIYMKTGEVLKGITVLVKKNADIAQLQGIEAPALIHLRVRGLSEVYVNGVSVGNTNRYGRLDLEVEAGRHRIEVKREGFAWESAWLTLSEGEITELEIVPTPLPDPNGMAIRSILIPGWGDLALGHSDFLLYPLVVYGSIYGAIVYSDKVDEQIWTTDPNTGKETLEKRGWFPVYAFAALAIGTWIYDIKHVYRSAEEVRAREAGYRPQSISMNLTPDHQGLMVSYKWDF